MHKQSAYLITKKARKLRKIFTCVGLRVKILAWRKYWLMKVVEEHVILL